MASCRLRLEVRELIAEKDGVSGVWMTLQRQGDVAYHSWPGFAVGLAPLSHNFGVKS